MNENGKKIGNNQNDENRVLTVQEIIENAIETAPDIDMGRQDMKRGRYYYISGGDPDSRNQI